MKKISILLCFISQIFFLKAQENSKHEFAIDAAPLLGSSNGYTLIYRYGVKDFRIRCLANYSSENKTNTSDENISTPVLNGSSITTNENSSNSNAEFRLGIQRNYSIEQWAFYFGADGIILYNQSTYSSETLNPGMFGKARSTSDSKATTESYGLAPLIGITYKINKRFTISLEESFAYLSSQTTSEKTKQEFFTPIGKTEYLNVTDFTRSSGESTKFDFTPMKYLRLYFGFRF